MTASTIPTLRTLASLSLAGALAALSTAACDLPDKDLGSDPMGSSTSDGDPATCDSPPPEDDCNTCSCEDGFWACTEIDCDPGTTTSASGSGDATDTGEPNDCDEPDPSDECNGCLCEKNQWICTEVACGSTGGEQCDPATDPSDACQTCNCVDGEWECIEESCETEPVGVCSPLDPLDPLWVTSAEIIGDELHLGLEYSGGCEVHTIGSCWDQSFAESEPVQAFITITHESNDDPCEAIESQDRVFDLGPLRDQWLVDYGGGGSSGTMIVNVAGRGALTYDFF